MPEETIPAWRSRLVFIGVSLALGIVAVISALHLKSGGASSPLTRPERDQLYADALIALRRSGYNAMATYIQTNPEIFFTSPASTIFAIKDSSSFTNVSISRPQWFWKHLLQYHTSPVKLPMLLLLKRPYKSCLPTILDKRKLVITRSNESERLVEINSVLIIQPDLFLVGNIVIHGVQKPFLVRSKRYLNLGVDTIPSSRCDPNFKSVMNGNDIKGMVNWRKIVRLLSFNRFIPFAVGLNSVLESILEGNRNLSSVTIFTPPDLVFVASPAFKLDQIIKFHIIARKLDYAELATMPDQSMLKTLQPGSDLELREIFVNGTRKLTVSGVEIVKAEIISSVRFTVHKIARSLDFNSLQD